MKHRTRLFLLSSFLLLAVAFAGWGWLRPYEENSDPKARCKVVATMVTRDRSFYWVHVHLKMLPGMSHDLERPVRLETAAGVQHAPADSTFGAMNGREPTELWFKFWLEPQDLAGPLTLRLNEGSLSVKTGDAMPDLSPSTARNFTTNRW